MLIDSHCHLTHEKLKDNTENIIKEAKTSGVEKIITVGTDLRDNVDALDIANNFENVFASIGIYPHEELSYSSRDFDNLLEQLETQLRSSSKIVGVGECGVDVSDMEDHRPLNEQIELFERHVVLAKSLDLPLVIHNREGDEKILEIIKKHQGNGLTGVVHCFVSEWDFAKKMLDLGFYISFSGIITYKSGRSIHETVEKIPPDRFLLETDAPWLSPEGFRGEVNEPKYVRITAQKVADIRNLPLQEIEYHAYQNTCTLFNLPKENYL